VVPNWTIGPLFGVSVITHRHTVVLLWTSDQLVAEASTYTGQHNIHINAKETNIHALSGIQTHDTSNQAAADLRLRPRGHRDLHGEAWWNDRDRENPKNWKKKPVPVATSSTANPTWTDQCAKPGLHGERLPANHLSYDMA
jgi:hypothetical protein